MTTTIRKVGIAGTGAYLPEMVRTNQDLEKMVDTSDEWIVTRTGIKERRILAPEQASSDMGAEAVKQALEAANTAPEDVDLVICATMTSDHIIPSTAALIAKKVGMVNAGAFDLGAACSGFVYGVSVARQFIATGTLNTVVVVGSESMSRMLDWTDRGTCIIFGDGAGAAVLKSSENGGNVLSSELHSRGDFTIGIKAGGSRHPATHDTVEKGEHLVYVEGRETFRFAVTVFRDLIVEALDKNHMHADELAMVIPHQVNLRIIEAAMKKVDIPMEKVFVNIDKYGNTSGASVGIALDEAVREGRIKSGDKVLLIAFGAGLTWGSVMLEW